MGCKYSTFLGFLDWHYTYQDWFCLCCVTLGAKASEVIVTVALSVDIAVTDALPVPLPVAVYANVPIAFTSIAITVTLAVAVAVIFKKTQSLCVMTLYQHQEL